ncbi:glycosyltransferase family 2 protein [bacterium]|nr:glycosyltransferase family 2 protein [bacterium]NUP92485.1 glycosyltransferase family 2 protein [Candidatus Omnitrophota bacterium]
MKSLTAFFPAHNEVENIGQLVEKTNNVLSGIVPDYEILVINDGSTDGTRELLDNLVQKVPRLRPIHHEVNQGYGGAVRTGFRNASRDLVFFSDGDGQFDIGEITLFLAEIDSYDAILGYRINRRDPFHRKVFAKCWGMLIRILFRIRVRDLDCAFKMFQRSILEGVEFEAGGAMVTVELLAKLRKKNFRFKEIGVNHYPRTAGQQSGGSPKVILRAFKELFKLYGRLN